MRALSIQFSGLVGILTFVSNVTSEVALELSVYRGLASAAALFFIMLISDLAIRAIARSNQPRHTLPPTVHTQGLEDDTGALAA